MNARRPRLALVGLALVLAGCAARPNPPSTTTSRAVCPLTGVPAPGGGVPERPALAVKVDNYPDARPQSGLDRADLVFEEPVEGGITRYVAVFQCQTATSVGPVRSARNIDIGILGQLGRPILAHVGGINPVIADINASPIQNFDLGLHGSVVTNPPGRVAPYDTYTNTSSIWDLYPTQTTAPAPLFSYAANPQPGTPATAISIPFSRYSPVVWRYEPTMAAYQRFYAGTPDLLADGDQNAATNVIVQVIQVTYGPWLENDQGGLEVQANLDQDAHGPALVFRGGVETTGTWSRSSLGQPTRFTSSTGRPIRLRPGPTWIELVPSTIEVTTSP